MIIIIFSPHCTFKDLGVYSVQQNGLITTHAGLLEVAHEHSPEDDAFIGQDHFVALVVLTKIRKFI